MNGHSSYTNEVGIADLVGWTVQHKHPTYHQRVGRLSM